MKKWILTLVLSLISANADAQCKRCGEIHKIEKEFLALKYDNSEDRSLGRKKMERVLAQLERFHQNKKSPSRKAEFKALVNLVAAALPYDMETEGPASLVDLVSTSQELNTLFNESLAGLKDSCRQQFLKAVMEERLCYEDAEKNGIPEDQTDRCIRSFDYGKCIGVKTQE